MTKLVEAPTPRDSVYCRWCSGLWGWKHGVRVCPHCDAASCDSATCRVCDETRGLTDTRPLYYGQGSDDV